jgi:hypothetical protein
MQIGGVVSVNEGERARPVLADPCHQPQPVHLI